MERPIPPDTQPMLHLRHVSDAGVGLAAIVVRPEGEVPPPLTVDDGTSHAPERIGSGADAVLWRYRFDLPRARAATYAFGGRKHSVNTDFSGDLSVAYTSCNGQEHGDLDRPVEARNALWRDLSRRNRDHPIHLILQGGDQIYADEVSQAHPLMADWPDIPLRPLSASERDEVMRALGDAFFRRYATQMAQIGFAEALTSIPSLSMWDDHDICDGWGSLPVEVLDSDLGQCLFQAARDAFVMFQMAHAPDEVPDIAMGRGHLSWRVDAPGVSFVAPDLRSTRRPDRVMDEATWSDLSHAVAGAPGHLFMLSSVPALGPRLSVIERLMGLSRRMEKYEDDLRDQWQSRSHRAEWQRFLRLLIDRHQGADGPVTVLSGEIHLATRATMDCADGPLQQLVASGISHPAPPRAFARGLGTLARLGEAPLKGHRIRLRPLPGRRGIYSAQRNYLMLDRRDGAWSARWILEDTGPTPPLSL